MMSGMKRTRFEAVGAGGERGQRAWTAGVQGSAGAGHTRGGRGRAGFHPTPGSGWFLSWRPEAAGRGRRQDAGAARGARLRVRTASEHAGTCVVRWHMWTCVRAWACGSGWVCSAGEGCGVVRSRSHGNSRKPPQPAWPPEGRPSQLLSMTGGSVSTQDVRPVGG